MKRRMLLLCLSLSIGIVFASIATAQEGKDGKHEAQLRTVHGIVTDKSESPIGSAVVFMKNTRSNAIRSYISDDQGNYRFSGLDPNIDYELHAEKDGAQSQTRTVSSFDSKKDITLNLKIEKKKS